jgi:outer membrane lipoprotein-sorting protein
MGRGGASAGPDDDQTAGHRRGSSMKRTPVWILALLTAAFFVFQVAEWHKHSELIGTWVAQWPDQMERAATDDAMLPKLTLTLYDDGTFTYYVETHVMANAVMFSSGKYARTGNIVTLSGTRKIYMDDGYQKGTDKSAWSERLSYTGNRLRMGNNSRWDPVFRREGDHTPLKPQPQPQPRPSDPKAVQIVHEMQRRYASLNTYSDEGTLRSSGTGFMASNARFRTRFDRPHKFRFQVTEFADGEELDKNVIWSNGKKSWWYENETGEGEGGIEERGLASALCAISPGAGYETMLVPALLLPADFGEPHIDAFFKEISLAGEESVSRKNCYVIRLSNPGGMDLKLWVDKSSYLILRAFDKVANATISYQPKRDIKIADAEIAFSAPK